jgi:HK97 family phage prohead protease
MTTKRRTVPVHGFKALTDEGAGTFEAVVSVFGNVDFAGDRIIEGAFEKSLERWAASGDPIPVIFSHRWDDLDSHVGVVLEAKELAPGDALLPSELAALGGLWVKARLDMDEDFAARLWKKLERRSIREFSFAYDTIDERKAKDGANELLELDVIEVGPTLKGMNPATALLDVKSAAGSSPELRRELALFLADVDVADGSKGVTHTFIPSEEDPTRCSWPGCGLTRSTLAHVSTLSAGPGGAKALVQLAGSLEEELASWHEPAYRWGYENAPLVIDRGGLYDVCVEATYPDDGRAIVRLEGWDDPYGEGRFFELTFADGDDGEHVVDAFVEVALEVSVTPKARAKAARGIVNADGSPVKPMKAGTVDRIGEAPANVDGNPEDPARGNGEDPKGRSGESSGNGGPARALLELDVLELG